MNEVTALGEMSRIGGIIASASLGGSAAQQTPTGAFAGAPPSTSVQA